MGAVAGSKSCPRLPGECHPLGRVWGRRPAHRQEAAGPSGDMVWDHQADETLQVCFRTALTRPQVPNR